jgi:hypothetical protein
VASPKLEGRITVPSGGWVVSVQEFTPNAGPASVTVAAAGDYYLSSSTSLLTTVAAALDANGTLAGDYTLALSSTTGLITLSATGVTTFNVTWTSTALRDALGFTGNLTGALSYAATKQSPYLFLPNCGRAPADAPEGTRGTAVTDGTITMAPTGHSTRLVGATRYRDRLGFMQLDGRRTWTTYESTVGESLQTFWDGVLAEGYPFRYHPDRTVDATYLTYVAVDALFGFKPLPMVPGWTTSASSLWGWETEVIEYVS